jgi:hypothetical protein
MKLLVSGCSIAHGTEIFNKFYHPKNIEGSFSKFLADSLKYELHNVALPAASNDYIFHSLVQNLRILEDVKLVVVLWTSTGRFSWKANGRHYFLSSGGASSMTDLLKFSTDEKLMHQNTHNGMWFSGDSENIVRHISDSHNFFVTDFFDYNEEILKLENYKTSLSLMCESKKINITQLTWDDIIDVGTWAIESRHPNIFEHKQIAERIHKKYDNKQQQ